MEPTKKDNDVLFIGSWSSECGNCGKSADPMERSHKTVLGYNPPDPVGCGKVWKRVCPTYLGMDETICKIRPDLEFISPYEAWRYRQ